MADLAFAPLLSPTLPARKESASPLSCRPQVVQYSTHSATTRCSFEKPPRRPSSLVPSAEAAASAPQPPDLPPLSRSDVTFANWTRCTNVDLPSLRLSPPTAPVRGLVAIVPVRTGETLVTVPSSLALQVRSTDSSRSPFNSVVSNDAWAGLPWYGRLALRLLHLRAELGPSTASTADSEARNDLRADWASLLPDTFDGMPLVWSEAELSELQSVRMRRSVHKLRAQYRAMYDSVCGSGSGDEEFVSYERFVWALQCVRSRSFAGELETAPFQERVRLFGFVAALGVAGVVAGALTPGQAANGAATAIFALAMYDVLTPRILCLVGGVRLKRYSLVPGVDFINHSSKVNGKAEVRFEYFSDCFKVAAGEDYGAGEEVAISYGAQSNDALLQFYGFVERGNPADDYVFEPEIAEMLGVGGSRLRAVRGIGFDDTTVAEVAKARFKGDEKAAKETLLDLARAELDGLPTTVEEDDVMLKECESGVISESKFRVRLACEWRREKKLVLKDVIALLDN